MFPIYHSSFLVTKTPQNDLSPNPIKQYESNRWLNKVHNNGICTPYFKSKWFIMFMGSEKCSFDSMPASLLRKVDVCLTYTHSYIISGNSTIRNITTYSNVITRNVTGNIIFLNGYVTENNKRCILGHNVVSNVTV